MAAHSYMDCVSEMQFFVYKCTWISGFLFFIGTTEITWSKESRTQAMTGIMQRSLPFIWTGRTDPPWYTFINHKLGTDATLTRSRPPVQDPGLSESTSSDGAICEPAHRDQACCHRAATEHVPHARSVWLLSELYVEMCFRRVVKMHPPKNLNLRRKICTSASEFKNLDASWIIIIRGL